MLLMVGGKEMFAVWERDAKSCKHRVGSKVLAGLPDVP